MSELWSRDIPFLLSSVCHVEHMILMTWVVSQSGLSGGLDTYVPAELVASRVILGGEKMAFGVQSLPFSALRT